MGRVGRGGEGAGVGAVGVDAGDSEGGFLGGDEVEGLVSIFGEVDHPEIGREAEEDGDGALDDEHVLPGTEAEAVVKGFVDGEVYDAAGGEDGDLAGLQECVAELLLSSGVPCGNEVGQTWVDACHGYTEKNTQCNHLTPCGDEGCRESNNAEESSDGGEEDARTDVAEGDGGGELEADGRDGEDEYGDTKATAVELEVVNHAGDGG